MDAASLAAQAIAAARELETDRAASARRTLARLRPALETAWQSARGEARFGIAVGLDCCLEQSADRERHLALLDEACDSLDDPRQSSQLAYRAARIEFLRGHRESALERAGRLSRARGVDGELAADALLIESAALRNLSAPKDALALANAALGQARPPSARMRAHFHRAAALCALGRLEQVEAASRQALALTLPLRAARQRALVLALLGLHADAAGRPALACEYLAEAARRFTALGDRIMAGKALGLLASCELAQGQARGRRTLLRAQRVVQGTGDRATVTELALASALQRLRGAEVRLRECLWDNQALGVPHLAERAERALAALGGEAHGSLLFRLERYQAILSEPGSRRLIDFARHEKPWRLLVALAEAKRDGGERLGVDALLHAGWPGERLLAASGQNRVYAAIRHLRRVGLGSVLRTSSAGYELVCSVRLGP